jgi:methylmalonyl-CoA mutase N-terminal domain/subunit
MWALIMRERFGAKDPRSTMLRFHTQTAGVSLTAQQPENNIVRVALQAFAAVCGGTQSLHTNGYDEALALPSEAAAKLALRTQQVIAAESGVTDTVDPFAGSYFVEALTDEIEERALALIAQIDELGGAVAAIDYIAAAIDESAWSYQERYRTGQDTVVGVNAYTEDDQPPIATLRVDPDAEKDQIARLHAFKAARNSEPLAASLTALHETAQGTANLLPPIREALRHGATIGETCGTMRETFGTHHPGRPTSLR